MGCNGSIGAVIIHYRFDQRQQAEGAPGGFEIRTNGARRVMSLSCNAKVSGGGFIPSAGVDCYTFYFLF